ncbi:nucleotidyltransferase domain-containing protein [Vulcanisaeta thermophila]|uniref:nucleotidyltransferase domain-containing protein n=1 Tax=Vulcanisaeta thermophila TaxID=867917 RepID=UPI000852FD22|nr:nucleotidyltransferase domain-containing protein [Vulcanisaeta thermophila]
MSFRELLLKIHGEVEAWVRELCMEGYTVILFGSRARGEARIDSDWDLLIISDKPPNDLAQAHHITPQEAPLRIREFNTIIIDALYEGKISMRRRKLYQKLREMVLEVTRDYTKTREDG